MQVYLGGIEAQELDVLQKGLDGVIAGSKHACLLMVADMLPWQFSSACCMCPASGRVDMSLGELGSLCSS